jgi:hypothetical protein
MDPVSPVAQLVVAAISGSAFLISMAVIPIPRVSQETTGAAAPLSFSVPSAPDVPPSVQVDFGPGAK